jgi:CheY-like chemotaxis protein
MVSLVLESGGYRVATATDGADALARIDRDGEIALVLLDLMMPRMDGEQFLRNHRAGAHAHVPVVIMSGHGGAWQKFTELRADGYLRKPVDLDELLGAVGRFLDGESRLKMP